MTSLTPELDNIVIAGGGSQQLALAIRSRCEILRGILELERATFLSQWKEIANFIMPRRPRFSISDVNKGDRRNQQIIDSTATEAAGVLAAGLMAGVTSPAREWFRLLTGYPDLDEQQPVKQYCHEVQTRMETVLLRSNFYNIQPILYGDMGTFGTGAIGMFDDDRTLVRFYDFPIGMYAVANDSTLRVRVFMRTLRFTVRQMVERWGMIDETTGKPNWAKSKLSLTVQNLYTRGNLETWIDVVHIIQPNQSYDQRKIDRKYKRFEDIYYELGSPNQPIDPGNQNILEHGGFEEFPILCGRWERNSEDVYGTNCPGFKAIGDIKQLQMAEKRAAQGLEKSINPPLTGPATLQNKTISVLPGDFTADDISHPGLGVRPIYQFDFAAALGKMEEKQEQTRRRIRDVFKTDIFMLFSNDTDRQKTATEVGELKEEKLLAMGPMLWGLNQDVLDPMIERLFGMMLRKGLLPDPPPELSGVELRVEYVSILHMAQKASSIAAIERAMGFVNQIAQTAPDVLDLIDDQEVIEEYFDALGVPPQILRDPKVVQALREQRQKAQQAAQAAENIGKVGGAGQLAKAPQDGSVLARMLDKSRARQSIDATAQPVASILP